MVGYAVLNAEHRSSAVSPEAVAIQNSASALVQEAETSIALFRDKADTISDVWRIVSECEEPGWDGENAEPVDEMAAVLATDFIRALPSGFPLPEVSPEPDGALSLDWIGSRYRLFSASVGRNNRIAFAWIDGADRGHGVGRFDGINVPPRIIQGILEVVRDEHAALRIA